MTKEELLHRINLSDIFTKWHYFKYHFNFYNNGLEHPLAKSIVEAILNIENIIPNAGIDYLEKLSSINSRKNYENHYDQLLQTLAELAIVNHVVTFEEFILAFEMSTNPSRSVERHPE